MPKPNSPLTITKFLGENDVIPATEMDDAQCSLAQNLYLVQGGLERRLGTAAVSNSLGSSKAIQGMQYCRLDGNINGSSMLSPLDPFVLPYLELYLRSDQVSGADGSTQAVITDLSPHARNTASVVGVDPTLRKTGANISTNGTQTLQWQRAGDNIQVTAAAGPISNTNGYTIIAYWKQIGIATVHGQTIFQQFSGASTAEFESVSNTANGYSSDGKYGFKYTAGSFATTTTAATTGWHLAFLEYSPPASGAGTVTLTVDGVALSPTPSGWTSSIELNGMLIGNNGPIGNSALDGAFGAFIVISNVYTAAVRDALGAYIRDFFEG